MHERKPEQRGDGKFRGSYKKDGEREASESKTRAEENFSVLSNQSLLSVSPSSPTQHSERDRNGLFRCVTLEREYGSFDFTSMRFVPLICV